MRCTSLIRVLILFVLTLLLIPISSATNQTSLLPARAKSELLSLQTKFSTRMNEHNDIMSLHLSGLKSVMASILDALHISLVDLMANGDNKTNDMEQVVKILFEKLNDGTTTKKKGTMTDSFDMSVRVARRHLKAMAKEIDSLYAFNKAMRSKMAILKTKIEAIDRQQAVPSFEDNKESLVKAFQSFISTNRAALIPPTNAQGNPITIKPNTPFHAEANVTAFIRYNAASYDCDLSMRVFFPSQIVADKEKDVAVTMVRESAEMSCAKTGITSKQEKQRKAKNNDVKVEYGWTGMELRSWWAVDS